jgi:hypothetical protein
VPLEPFHETASFRGWKGLVKRGGFVCAEIILDRGDLCGVRKPAIRQVFEESVIIHRRVTIRDLDVPLAFERCEQHADIGGSVALVLVIGPRGRPGFAGIARLLPTSEPFAGFARNTC